MRTSRPHVLWVTDLAYSARDRRYCDEDIFFTSRLHNDFAIAMCSPRDMLALMDQYDAVVLRNCGPVLNFRDEWEAFRSHAISTGACVYPQMVGHGDQAGKQYMLDLFAGGYPVIPTVGSVDLIDQLPSVDEYVVKPMAGGDSIGLQILSRSALIDEGAPAESLIQPKINFQYEVSFYFIDHEFQYAMYAPDCRARWELQPYEPTEEDLRFAQKFIEWNTISRGIERIDACRTASGELLLMELEDLNPYLSLDLLLESERDRFVNEFRRALDRTIAESLGSRRSVAP